MNTKHTKGPWNTNELISRVEADHRLICSVVDGKGNCFNPLMQDIETQQANAVLIAAAPEMLEILLEIKEQTQHTRVCSVPTLMKLNSVIEKATTIK